MSGFTESVVEEAALEWLERAGWTKVYGETIAPDSASPERAEFTQTALETGLRAALTRLNPGLPASAVEDAFRHLLNPTGPDLVARNRVTHRHLVNGVNVEYKASDGPVARVGPNPAPVSTAT